jgi:hypothetical protein
VRPKIPLLAHLEGIWKLVVGHAGFPPGGFSELQFVLLGRPVLLLCAVLLLGLEVEVVGIADNLFGLADGIVRRVLVGPQCRHLLVHHNKLYEYQFQKPRPPSSAARAVSVLRWGVGVGEAKSVSIRAYFVDGIDVLLLFEGLLLRHFVFAGL